MQNEKKDEESIFLELKNLKTTYVIETIWTQ